METYIAVGIIGILSIIFLVIGANGRSKYSFLHHKYKELDKRYRELDKAKTRYFQSLDKLKNNPNNPELKQRTLKLGREYSALTREYQGQNKSVTVYDEMALMNDINAACAGATVISSKIEKSLTVEERLEKLSELKEKNLINEEEYETRRQKILDEI